MQTWGKAAAAAALMLALSLAVAGAAQAQAQDYDLAAEVRAAQAAIDAVSDARGGMGGLGVIAEPDLAVINGMISESENLLREARLRAQSVESLRDQGWVVGYARASRAMAEAALDILRKLGY